MFSQTTVQHTRATERKKSDDILILLLIIINLIINLLLLLILFLRIGAAMSIFLFTGFTYLPRIKDITVPRLSDQLPDRFEPTLQVPTGVGNETAPRDWLVDMSDMPVWGVFAAILPAIVLTVLFFFDHNVSSLLSQKEEFKLRKGSAYHWDFFVIGLMILLCGFIGVPPVNGLIPQVSVFATLYQFLSFSDFTRLSLSHFLSPSLCVCLDLGASSRAQSCKAARRGSQRTQA